MNRLSLLALLLMAGCSTASGRDYARQAEMVELQARQLREQATEAAHAEAVNRANATAQAAQWMTMAAPTQTPIPTVTPMPTWTATPEPTMTATPVPTMTPTPTVTPMPLVILSAGGSFPFGGSLVIALVIIAFFMLGIRVGIVRERRRIPTMAEWQRVLLPSLMRMVVARRVNRNLAAQLNALACEARREMERRSGVAPVLITPAPTITAIEPLARYTIIDAQRVDRERANGQVH